MVCFQIFWREYFIKIGPLKPYDIRALVPIIKNSGGIIKSWEGKSVYNGGKVIATTNKKLFLETQKILLKK